jgi:hypothetical protein
MSGIENHTKVEAQKKQRTQFNLGEENIVRMLLVRHLTVFALSDILDKREDRVRPCMSFAVFKRLRLFSIFRMILARRGGIVYLRMTYVAE